MLGARNGGVVCVGYLHIRQHIPSRPDIIMPVIPKFTSEADWVRTKVCMTLS